MTRITSIKSDLFHLIKQIFNNYKESLALLNGREEKISTHKDVIGYAFQFFDLKEYPNSRAVIKEEIPKEIKNAIDALILSLDSKFDIKNVLFLSLAGNSKIPKHIDSGKYLSEIRRFHLPIISDDCLFNSMFVDYRLSTGVWYELLNNEIHAVTNYSKNARVHLLVDLYELKQIG